MPQKETELVLYVELDDSSFQVDGSENWNQYEAEFKNGTRIRLRSYHNDIVDKPYRYIQTIKIKNAGADDKLDVMDEYSCPVPIGFAEGFIRGAESIQRKNRSYFKSNKVTLKLTRGDEVEAHEAPELTLEVDRFVNSGNGYHKWVKIDIEIDKLLEWIKVNYGRDEVTGYNINLEQILPVKVLRIIHGKTKDAEEKSILEDLWENTFKKKMK